MQSYSVFLLAFLTSIATSVGTLYVADKMELMPHAEAPKPLPSVVPQLAGLSETDARVSLATQGLILLLGPRESNANAAADSVIKQSIAAGSKVPRGDTVTVTLAAAKVAVPNVVGRTVEEANKALQTDGLKLQLGQTRPDPEAPPGQVIAQQPAAESLQVKGATVTVDVSAGVESSDVPNVVGLSFKTAKEKLEQAGYKLTTRWVRMAETQTYVALDQDPKAGTKLKKGENVTITANRE